MIELQKHLMQLVKEIDQTCRFLDIPYSLCERTAGRAIEYGKFTNNTCEFHIMLFAKDALKLKKELLSRKNPDRGIEDLSTNPDLPRNHIRYVDTGTTLIDRDDPIPYELMGVSVIIHPVYTKQPSKAVHALEIGNIYINGGKEFNEYNMASLTKVVIQGTKTFCAMFGKKKLAKELYGINEKQNDAKLSQEVFLRRQSGLLVRIPAKTIFKTKRVPFEGMELPVPANYEEYFEIHYGENWREKYTLPYETTNRVVVIGDAQRSYKEYIKDWEEQGISMEEIKKERFDLFMWQCHRFNFWKTKTYRTYANAKRSMDRIDLYCYYQDKMTTLQKMADKKDIAGLKELMEPYLECTEYYLKKRKMGFYINDDLFAIAKVIWEAENVEEDYAKQVYDLVPEIYKKEDVGEFLAKYR